MKFSRSNPWSRLFLLCLTLLAGATAPKAQSYLFETLAGAPKLSWQEFDALTFDAGDTFYFASGNVIYGFSAVGGIRPVAGSVNVVGPWDGPASSARFSQPQAVVANEDGTLYVADGEHVDELSKGSIRIISPAGQVSTLTLAEDSEIRDFPGRPLSLAADRNGNLYFTIELSHALYRIDAQRRLHVLPTDYDLSLGLAVDDQGNAYVSDSGRSLILKITPQGEVTTVADSNTVTEDGQSILLPSALAVDGHDTLYLTCFGKTTVFKIALTPKPTLSIYAGKPDVASLQDGPVDTATFLSPGKLAVDHQGRVHVVDPSNDYSLGSIRQISGGMVATLIGPDTNTGSRDGQGHEARFNHPEGVAVDASQTVFVADTGNSTIRQISAAGVVTTLAGQAGVTGSDDGSGSAARFANPSGIAMDSHGNIYVADTGNHIIRRITPAGKVSTVAGTKGMAGYQDGRPSQFSHPIGIAIGLDDTVYVADTGNQLLRRILKDGQVQTISISYGLGPVRAVNVLTNGLIFTVVQGSGYLLGFQPGQNVGLQLFAGPPADMHALASDVSGNLFISSGSTDPGNTFSAIRQAAGSAVRVIAGSFDGLSDGVGRRAEFRDPLGMATDRQGNLYVADTGNSTIRKGVPNQGAVLFSDPRSTNVDAGFDVTFRADAGGTPPLAYQWRFNGTNLPGATNATLTLNAVTPDQTGYYDVSVGNAFGSDLSRVPTYLTVQATRPQTAPKGNSSATIGSPYSIDAHATGARPWVFQWFLNGQPLAAQTNQIMSLAAVTPADSGSYTVTLTNPYGVSANAFPINLRVVGVPPSANFQASQTAFIGEDAMFIVRPTGSGPINCQWLHDGVPLPDATNAALRLIGIKATDAGNYTATLSSPYGTFTTKPAAKLTVLDSPPTILRQPSSQDLRGGSSVSFRAEARGTAPLGYQWQRNGQAIEGATNATLLLAGVTEADAGRYAVTVSNGQGLKASDEAILTVTALTEAAIPEDLAVLFGDDVTLDAPGVDFPVSSYLWSQSALGGSGDRGIFGAYQPSLAVPNASVLMSGKQALRTWTDYSVRVADESGAGVKSGPAILSSFPATPALLPIGLAGWNYDVILEDGPLSRVDVPFDGTPGGYECWVEAGVQSHGDGLPPSRRLASAKDTNVIFELQPYAGPNALWTRATVTNTTASLRLVRPARYSRIATLAATTYGYSEAFPGLMVLQFADGSSSDILNYNCPDWWVNSSTNFLALGGLTEAVPRRLTVTNNNVQLLYPTPIPPMGWASTRPMWTWSRWGWPTGNWWRSLFRHPPPPSPRAFLQSADGRLRIPDAPTSWPIR